MIIDTHAHLDFPEFAGEIDALIERAASVGVTRIVTIGTNVEGSRRAVALAEQYPGVYAAIGIHPNSAMEAEPDAIEALRELAKSPRVVAIGETGLDYYRLPSSRLASNKIEALANEEPANITAAIEDGAVKSAQSMLFQQQLDLAVELGLNVVIHQRGPAWEDTLDLLQPYQGKLRAVFHCFGGTPEQAEEVIQLGHLVSFTGIVTFKNAQTVQETAASIAPGTFMLETDAPYLAPIPFRGKRCEPAYTRLTAEKVAALRGDPLDEIARITSATAEEFFRFNR
ncbi:MAG: TatD family hydrolase [Verrucomicrobiota bacterium]